MLNSGSSSIKYAAFETRGMRPLLRGELERIGEPGATLTQTVTAADGTARPTSRRVSAPSHREAFRDVVAAIAAAPDGAERIGAVGHRVVHGGDRYVAPVVVDDAVVAAIGDAAALAPMENPANLLGIREVREWRPGLPQVAVFDTWFHRTLPPRAYRYALPHEAFPEHPVRRFGFHGTSHDYVSRAAAAALGRPRQELRMITLHLGSGASACAVLHGESVDTSMGMTPLEGLMMGSRPGDLDPGAVAYLSRVAGLATGDVERMLYERAGLRGVCGHSDMCRVHELADAGDPDAGLALDMYCYRARKYVGAYSAAMDGLDALVFTGGVGQRDPVVRERVCEGLGFLGVTLDEAGNRAPAEDATRISADGAPVAVLVVPTDEELEIARHTAMLLRPDETTAEEPTPEEGRSWDRQRARERRPRGRRPRPVR